MRYHKASPKASILQIIKHTLSILTACSVFALTLSVLNSQIISSAMWITLGYKENPSTNKVIEQNSNNFEEDFNLFTKQKEQIEVQNTISNITNNNAIAVNLSATSGKYKNYNGTSVINNTNYDITSLLNAKYELPEINKDEPYILIYHTHTSEEYYGGGTVVDVGNTLANEFEKLGYKTIHITTVYDKEQFSGAYSRSVNGASEILEKYPSIKLVFDVHRDAITTQNGKSYRPITQINGEECAQVMFVCGTDEKGLSHPEWRENFKFALDVSRTVENNYSALSRPVNLRGDRFNTHLTNHAFLIEVGSNANTLSEANLAAIYTARSIVKTIEKQ